MTAQPQLWPWNQTGYVVEIRRRVASLDEEGEPVVDGHGSPVMEHADPVPLPFAVFAPAPLSSSSEPFRGGRPDLLVDLPAVYAPADAEVSNLDRLLVNGEEFEVAAEPGRWDDPASGETFGISIPLRRVEG